MRNVILILAFAAIFTSCVDKKESVNIQELNQQFINAWNARDADKVVSLLGEDVHFLQGEIHFQGKSEVADKWVRSTMGTITDLKTNVVSSGTGEDIAYEAGTFSVDVLPAGPDQPGGVGEGNFMLLWKKGAEGEWKLHYAQLEDLPVQAKNM
ncbi:YybH family protein [Pontibacter sp. MBLB2868]|uniref:YybH family protein n=1 Tax=Pontibacter sp. MBLB2868 TaxID=3451555 RepID=UPI003F74CA48